VTRKTVTREDLTEAVQRTIGLSLGEARTLVSQVLETIATTLERGETVKLSSFGSFVVRQKGERLGRNPKTLEPATIRPRRVLVFKPSVILKQQINSSPGHTSVRATERSQAERNP
jgi:integration host factor subunit alpha